MKFKRESAQKLFDLHNNVNFVMKVQNETLRTEINKINDVFNYCNQNNVDLFYTKSQIELLKKYSKSGGSYIAPKSTADYFKNKLYLMNVQAILENSLTRQEKRLNRFKKNSIEVSKNLESLKEISTQVHNDVFIEMLSEKERVKKHGKNAYYRKPRSEYQISDVITKRTQALNSEIILAQGSLVQISDNEIDLEEKQYLREKIVELSKQKVFLESMDKNINNLMIQDSDVFTDIKEEVQAYCDAKNEFERTDQLSLKKLNKKFTTTLVVAVVSFFSLTAAYVAGEATNFLSGDPAPVVDDNTNKNNDKKDQHSNFAIAQYIIQNNFFDSVTLKDYTHESLIIQSQIMKDLINRELSTLDHYEIVGMVNDHIKELRQTTSMIQIFNGEGYSVESNASRIKNGDKIVVSFNIQPGFEYDEEINELKVGNATVESINAKIKGNVISYELAGLKIENVGENVFISIGDLFEKSKLNNFSVSLPAQSSFGSYQNIGNTSDISYDEGFSFGFNVVDAYTQTKPKFFANGVEMKVQENADYSYYFTVPKQVLRTGKDVVITDETDWQLNKYKINYQAGEGWKFENMPETAPHGRDFFVYIEIKEGFQGVPEVRVNGKLAERTVSAEFGFIKYKISATEEIEIVGTSLQPKSSIETRNHKNDVDSTNTQKNGYTDIEEGGTTFDRE